MKDIKNIKRRFLKNLTKIKKASIFIFLAVFLIFGVAATIKIEEVIKSNRVTDDDLQFFFKDRSLKSKDNFDDIDVKIRLNFDKNNSSKIVAAENKKLYPDYVYSEIAKNIGNPDKEEYVKLLADLPWFEEAEENNDLEDIKKNILNESHIRLFLIKKSIFEFLLDRSCKKQNNKILFLFGPKGVEKAMIAKTIAKILHRPFQKVSLTGLSDPACKKDMNYDSPEYMKILEAIKDTHVNNPVIFLKENNKTAKKSNFIKTLLEVFNEAHNKNFNDKYFNVPFDIDKVLFIVPADSIDDIPLALMDQIELINIPAYNNYQKKEIIKNKLLPKYSKKLGLKIIFSEQAIDQLLLLSQSKNEGGIYELKKRIKTLIVKELKKKIKDKKTDIKDIEEIAFDKEKVDLYLNEKCFFSDSSSCCSMADEVGAFNAMYYMVGHAGGAIKVRVLTRDSGKKKGEIKYLGFSNDDLQAKDVILKGFQYLARNADRYSIPMEKIFNTDIVIQTAEGSAGSSMTLGVIISIISAFKNIPIRGDVAFSGVIDQFGKVNPVGGLYEKIIATYDLGFRNFIIPKDNAEDIKMIPQEFIEGARFYFVRNIDEALPVAFKND